jgi:hypothetical protein
VAVADGVKVKRVKGQKQVDNVKLKGGNSRAYILARLNRSSRLASQHPHSSASADSPGAVRFTAHGKFLPACRKCTSRIKGPH